MKTIIACVLFSAVALGATAPDLSAVDKLQQARKSAKITNDARKVAAAMADFGFKLQRENAHVGQNLTTSPFSLVSAFGLVLNGAEADTLKQISGALALPNGLNATRFNQGYQSLHRALAKSGPGNTFSFGNALFLDQTFAVRDAYHKAVAKALGADAQAVDFQDTVAAAKKINSYVETQTQKMIQDMVSADAMQGWRIALVNAGYFKGTWDLKFDVAETDTEGKFHTASAAKDIPLMYLRRRTFLYYPGEGFQMVSLAYRNGDFAFDLILPTVGEKETPDEAAVRVQKMLTGEHYRQWLDDAKPQKLSELALPRFEAGYKQDLRDYFQRQMPAAFGDAANFHALSPEPIRLNNVIHASLLKINEEGTEAAAATVISGYKGLAVPVKPDPSVVADHPFLFVIRHVGTGVPLFVGTIYDPKALPPAAAK